MPSCSQCGKQAIVSVRNNPLCVDCYLKFQQAIQIQDNSFVQEMNYLINMMEATTGIFGVLPRYTVQRPLIHQGPLTFHNIKVDQSVIGSINTGEVKRIDVTMEHIKTSGNDELVQVLKEFIEAVIAETNLENKFKNEIIEQISFLSSQSILQKERQKSGIVKAVMMRVKDIVSTIATLLLLWEKLEPILERIFS